MGNAARRKDLLRAARACMSRGLGSFSPFFYFIMRCFFVGDINFFTERSASLSVPRASLVYAYTTTITLTLRPGSAIQGSLH